MFKPGLSFGVNPLFLLVIVFFAVCGLLGEALTAFSLVILHEFVHLLAARILGYGVKKIELFPFGGMAVYGGLLEMDPWKEARVALAGPLFNLCLAGVILLAVRTGLLAYRGIVPLIYHYSLLLGLFNLLPALPLDGGRVLRALLVASLGFRRGSELAVRFAKLTALSGALAALGALVLEQVGAWLLLLAFFVYGAALREERQIIYLLINYLTHREQIIREMAVKPGLLIVIKDNIPIREAVYYLNPVRYNLFYVLKGDLSPAGTVTESRLLESFFRLKDRELKMGDIIN